MSGSKRARREEAFPPSLVPSTHPRQHQGWKARGGFGTTARPPSPLSPCLYVGARAGGPRRWAVTPRPPRRRRRPAAAARPTRQPPPGARGTASMPAAVTPPPHARLRATVGGCPRRGGLGFTVEVAPPRRWGCGRHPRAASLSAGGRRRPPRAWPPPAAAAAAKQSAARCRGRRAHSARGRPRGGRPAAPRSTVSGAGAAAWGGTAAGVHTHHGGVCRPRPAGSSTRPAAARARPWTRRRPRRAAGTPRGGAPPPAAVDQIRAARACRALPPSPPPSPPRGAHCAGPAPSAYLQPAARRRGKAAAAGARATVTGTARWGLGWPAMAGQRGWAVRTHDMRMRQNIGWRIVSSTARLI